MSADPNEPLDPELADLFRRESEGYPEERALRERVFAKVETALVVGGGSETRGSSGPSGHGAARTATSLATAAKSGGLGKILAVGIGAFVAGGVARDVVSTARRAPPSATAAPSSTTSGAASATRTFDPGADTSPLPPASVATAEPPATAPAPSSASSASPTAASTEHDLTRERELLDVAQAALARGRAEDAFLAAQRHADRWPHGALSEEREVVLIKALVALGRRPEAEQRATRFRKAFPRSMLVQAVDQALGVDASTP
jgi:hypothetical protein